MIILKQIVQSKGETYIPILFIECFTDINSNNEILIHYRHNTYPGGLMQFFCSRIKEITVIISCHFFIESIFKIIRKR